MACIARLSLEYCLPFRSQGISGSESRVHRSYRRSRKVGLERLFHEHLFILVLSGDLRRGRRIAHIVAMTQASQNTERDEHGGVDRNRNWALPRPAFRTPIKERQQE